MTKVEAIKQLMLDNGGIANWKMIYSQIENYYPNAKKSTEWQAGLRGVYTESWEFLSRKYPMASIPLLNMTKTTISQAEQFPKPIPK